MDDALWILKAARLSGRSTPRLRDVTLTVRPGITAVMGCSGAGKTSLLNLLVGYERPESGTVASQVEPGGHSLPIFWVPQDDGLWPHLTVAEHLHAVRPTQVPESSLGGILTAFDLEHCAGSRPDSLSMGERSRLAVARAVAADPAVLVMDEPLLHVDRVRAGDYRRRLRRHCRTSGASLVFSTHMPEAVLGDADRVICLREGELLYEGTVEDLYYRPETQEQAECLGEVNWLEPRDVLLWLPEGDAKRACYRPEHIVVQIKHDGPLEVRRQRFRGSVAEVTLAHRVSGKERTFFHRPARGILRKGMKVALRLLAVFLIAFALSGCGAGSDPQLEVRAVRYWPIPADGASIPGPRSIALAPDGEAVVLDEAGRVLVFGPDGKVRRQWRMPDVARGRPEGVCVMADGRIAVCDTHYHRVVFFDAEGNLVGQFGEEGRGPGQFIYPVGIAQDDEGHLYVCEYGGNDRVQKFTANGEFLAVFGASGTGEGEFQRPSGLAWRDGRVLVADAVNDRILEFGEDGAPARSIGGHAGQPVLDLPYGVAVAPDGGVFVVEYSGGCVRRLSADGRLVGTFGSPGYGEGQFRTPWGLAADEGRILVADTGNSRIVELEL
jgi:iron(III) transport system ATP-binding protein